MYSKYFWKQKCYVIIRYHIALQVTEYLMLFICIYVLFQSLLISEYLSFNFKTENPQAVLESAISDNDWLYLGFHVPRPLYGI